MNEKNDFALVPRTPTAVEKAEPGAKRILAVMVADVLALAPLEDPESLFCKGRAYLVGDGVPKDSTEAVKWFRKAAEQGHAEAQSTLGWMYDKGDDVPKDSMEPAISQPVLRHVPFPSAHPALAPNHLALLRKILPPAVLGPVPGRPWEIAHLGLNLVWIEPGAFLMGSADGDEDERPVTRVKFTRGFWLGRTALTRAQWADMLENNPSYCKDAGKDAPVAYVTWNEAMAFCKELTEREQAAGHLPAGYRFTLPTEAQWEYACRAGTTEPYAGDLDAMAWYYENSNGTPHPVGTKQPNAWGLYDMHGNISEWCFDWYGSYPGGVVTDPMGPASGSNHVRRGGCWAIIAECCRSAARDRSSSDGCTRHLGFRLALISSSSSSNRSRSDEVERSKSTPRSSARITHLLSRFKKRPK
jgi:formylglycine-generating enzyme required for sulfatase activity